MSDEASADGTDDHDRQRSTLVPIAIAAVAVAVLAEPAGWLPTAALLPPLAAVVLWSLERIGIGVLVAVVLPCVALSQLTDRLEPALFLLSVLALILTGWHRLSPFIVGALLADLAVPSLVALAAPETTIAVVLWTAGIAFPAAMGYVVHRQDSLQIELASARARLAEQAAAEQRRVIARDVHDLVGHALAGMMLQITSARHVLRRDPDGAEAALASAEDLGRRSMRELRRTVSALRSDGTVRDDALPGLDRVEELVSEARDRGLRVMMVARGDPATVDDGLGLVVYRIVQEALVNATRYAPEAEQEVVVEVGADQVSVTVDSRGPVRETDEPDRSRFGVRGMRERVATVGGTMEAGRTPTGWRVHAVLPSEGLPDGTRGDPLSGGPAGGVASAP